MFTGIIETVGEIVGITADTGRQEVAGQRLAIRSVLDLSGAKVGDSIAVDGICLTAVAIEQNTFSVDVSRETLNCTCGFRQGNAVNLEQALRASDRMGGHWVSGHVDGVGEVVEFAAADGSALLRIAAPNQLMKYITRKGSITVQGVSLTVNAADRATFSVNLIPHTLRATNLSGLRPNSKVNLEVDTLARYVERLLEQSNVVR